MKLNKDFYSKDARVLAQDLLGKVLVHKIDGNVLKGIIVETEAYIGLIDKASHAYGNKRTPRVAPLYGPPGTTYVYSIYGMYRCFNIISGIEGNAEGVLIRGLEPIENLDIMANRRFKTNYSQLNKNQIKNFTNGPAKLCIAMGIGKEDNWKSVLNNEDFYVENGEHEILKENIIQAKRVGIDYAEEAVDFLWRFYIKGNLYVSKL